MDPTEPPVEHMEFMCEKLEAIERRDIMRLALSMPPGHAKTKYFSRYFPAWYLGRNPHHQYLQGGHSQKFVENQMGKFVRDIIDNPLYQEVFPNVTLKRGQTAGGEWALAGKRGTTYVAKGAGQGIAGFRANCGGIDDPFGSREEASSDIEREKRGNWLTTDVQRRLLPFSPLFIVATRWHPDDLIGRVERLRLEKRGIPWEVINLVAIIESEDEMENDPLGRSMGEVIWPYDARGQPMYDAAYMADAKSTMPTYDWQALYKGKPRDQDGNIVKGLWVKRYDVLPRDKINDRRIRRITVSVDCAEKANERTAYTAIGVWIEDMERRHHLAHVVRERLEFPAMITRIEDVARDWHATAILVEDAGAGTQYIQMRQGRAPAPIISQPTGNKSKEFRFDAVAPMFEAGEVWLPKQAPWLADYEEEILAFPNATFKDQADMTSQYLAWARGSQARGPRRLKGTRLN